jgi:hypothetical protein
MNKNNGKKAPTSQLDTIIENPSATQKLIMGNEPNRYDKQNIVSDSCKSTTPANTTHIAEELNISQQNNEK